MKSPRLQATSDPPFDQPELAKIRVYVDELLVQPAFAASQRKARLLRYLVDRTLAGEGAQITEYGIGLDVFEKPATFDPRIDSAIRSEISRLRQKLKEHYSNGGSADRIVIDFPQRSYIPAFTFAGPAPAVIPVKARHHWHSAAAIGLAVAALLAGSFAAWRVAQPAQQPIGSLVVLPFQNLSPNPQDEYLADGLTEELTNQLAQWPDLRIVARTSAFQFKKQALDVREIGRRLNVDAVLEGSFERQGERIRITAQLNRASNGYHLWSRAYEARSRDVMTVQDEMARSIASAVRGVGRKVSPRSSSVSTNSPEAHDLYLQANYQLSLHTPDSYRKGRDLLDRALEKDPSYVNAYLDVARVEIALIHITAEAPREGLERARRALEKALELDPRSAEAHGEMADLVYVYDWDWPRAEREFRLALENGAQATTHSFYGWGLATQGRFEEAHSQFRMAQDLDPLGMGPRTNEFMAYYLERKYPEARKTLRDILESKPDLLDAHLLLGLLDAVQNDCHGASAEFEWSARKYTAPLTKFGLALVCACRGQVEQSRRYLAEAAAPSGSGYTSPYQLALGYAWLHDKERALAFLDKSAEAREGQILYIKYEPIFDGIRSDPRFAALEKRVGLRR